MDDVLRQSLRFFSREKWVLEQGIRLIIDKKLEKKKNKFSK